MRKGMEMTRKRNGMEMQKRMQKTGMRKTTSLWMRKCWRVNTGLLDFKLSCSIHCGQCLQEYCLLISGAQPTHYRY